MYRVVVTVVLGLLCIPAVAQDKLEVFGGYEYLHNGNVTLNGVSQPNSSQGYNGWNAAATFKLNRLFGVEGDFSGAYATNSGVNLHVYTYTAGPVVTIPMPMIRPFVHALFGGIQQNVGTQGVSTTFNGFTTMVGGGVDAKINRLLAIRLGQVDWLYYHFGSQTIAGSPFPAFSGSTNVRFSTGVVLRF